jgi:hypothetical protein
VVVGDDLLGDPLGRRRFRVLGSGEDVDRDGGQSGVAGGQGAPLAVADLDAVGGADRRDGLQHTVFAHTGQELRVQGGVVADVVAKWMAWGSRCSRVPAGSVLRVVVPVIVCLSVLAFLPPVFEVPCGPSDLAGTRTAQCKVRGRKVSRPASAGFSRESFRAEGRAQEAPQPSAQLAAGR